MVKASTQERAEQLHSSMLVPRLPPHPHLEPSAFFLSHFDSTPEQHNMNESRFKQEMKTFAKARQFPMPILKTDVLLSSLNAK